MPHKAKNRGAERFA